MFYESQGIFPEGWALDFRQETRSVTHQHATSARSRTPKAKREADCEQCGKTFIVKGKALGKFCSIACNGARKKRVTPDWMECSRCLSTVGIGMAMASRLLGVTKSSIHRSWNREGIRAQLPKGVDSWRQYTQRVKSPFHGWWGNAETAAAWMSQHKEVFPDWGSLFKPYMAAEQKEKFKAKYHALSDEEKKSRNKRLHEQRKIRHAENPMIKVRYLERINAWKIRNPEKNKESRIKSTKKRKLNDPGFRVQCNLRHRLKEIMRKVKKGGTEHRNNLTGCSTRQLADHLESTFKRGMTWDNYGTRWHVDHIIPCAVFDQTDESQRAQCWHWTNLRALDAQKNMDKSDKITEPQMSLLLCATR